MIPLTSASARCSSSYSWSRSASIPTARMSGIAAERAGVLSRGTTLGGSFFVNRRDDAINFTALTLTENW